MATAAELNALGQAMLEGAGRRILDVANVGGDLPDLIEGLAELLTYSMQGYAKTRAQEILIAHMAEVCSEARRAPTRPRWLTAEAEAWLRRRLEGLGKGEGA